VFALKAAGVAIPDAFVLAEVVLVPESAKLPLAPELGAVKVTVIPANTWLPNWSATRAPNGAPKFVFTTAVCGVVAETGDTLDGAPGLFVIAKLAGEATPETVACTVYAPAVVLAVKVEAVATPEPLLVAVVVLEPENAPLAPLLGAVKVTKTLGTGLFPQSVTVAPRLVPKAVFTTVVCGVPADGDTSFGGPTVMVRANVAGVTTPLTLPDTLNDPKTQLAVSTAAVAIPEEFVVAVVVVPPPAKVPLDPEEGAVNVTVTAGTGLFPLSFTMAARFVAKAVPAAMLCGVPALVAMDAGAPTVFVNEKSAGVATPETVA
jgi:hypothetical protein